MPFNNDTAANWLSRVAKDEASAARRRARAAQQQASDARRRVRFVARNGAVWKILQFFEDRTPAAWGALWYLLLSLIGVTYSWAFYSQYEDIHIFDFFGTSDFLLSAFQNMEMLIIGISATLIGIGILIYRAYDSIVYSAYKSDHEKREVRILLEAVISLSITLGLIIGLLHYYSSAVCLPQISTDIFAFLLPLLFSLPPPLLLLTYHPFRRVPNPISEDRQQDKARIRREASILLLIPPGLIIGILSYYYYSAVRLPQISADILAFLLPLPLLLFLTYRFFKRVQNPISGDKQQDKARIRREAFILLLIPPGLVIGILSYYYSSAVCLPQISTDILAFLLPLPLLLFLTYRFFKRVQNPNEAKQQDQANWEVGILLFLLLAEATLILPFLHGRSDSEAKRQDKDRRAQVVVHQDSVQPGTRLPKPDRTLLLGTTSSFHFFYECEKALNAGTDSKCKKGRSFIVPTANIASLEFYQNPVTCVASATSKASIACPESDPEGGSDAPRVGLSHVIDAITALNTTISKLKFNAIFQMESGNVILDVTDVAKAVAALNQTIAEFEQLIVSDPAQSVQIVKALTALNKTISEFQPSVDPVRIVEAIETNTTKITTAIEGIYIPPEVQNHCGPGWKRVAIIGPFCEGRHNKMEEDAEEDAEGCKKENGNEPPSELVIPDELLRDLRSLFEAGTLQQLMLVGRVDITQLDENQRKYYGSNNGLAQARAKRVLDELVEKWASNNTEKKALLERTILLSAGPLHVGQGEEYPTDTERAKDRSVEVWACGGSET